jgi:S-adenosylmethionine:tRNA ribosyltransferase-isomerase
MLEYGTPIRYGYVHESLPLSTYQTVFARVPGSAEMPSAAYPFTEQLVTRLKEKGIHIAALTLHTGVSSLEVDVDEVQSHPLYPEPCEVPRATAAAVNAARAEGRRVIAVGTTVVRALETAWDGGSVRPLRGFTRAYIHPARGAHVVDGLITGLHDPVTSHLAMLYAIAGQEMIRSAYGEAVSHGYLWHEFGDSHLILSCAACREQEQREALQAA